MRWLALILIALSKPDPLVVSIYPPVQMAPLYKPASVRIRVTVERNEHNRYLEYGFYSEDYVRSETLPWPGLDAPRTFTAFYALPAGEYMAMVLVHLDTGQARQQSCHFRIIGADAEPPPAE